MKTTGVYLLLFVFALILLISGVEGSFGRVLAVVFVPDKLAVAQGS